MWSFPSTFRAAPASCAGRACTSTARPLRSTSTARALPSSAIRSSTARFPEARPSTCRFVYLPDVLPTAWQAVEYAAVPPGGSIAVLGLGPIGDMSTRIAAHRGAGTVIGIDLVPERLERARRRGIHALDLRDCGDDLTDAVRSLTAGRRPDAVIDAVGMEAHGSRAAAAAQGMTTLLPDALTAPMMKRAGIDRVAALYAAIDMVRRGGTISVSGVYGGAADPMPLLTMFDKQLQLRMGQANVHRWVGDILPLLTDEDPLGVDGFATHRLSLEQAPDAYEMFQKKQDGAVKVLFTP